MGSVDELIGSLGTLNSSECLANAKDNSEGPVACPVLGISPIELALRVESPRIRRDVDAVGVGERARVSCGVRRTAVSSFREVNWSFKHLNISEKSSLPKRASSRASATDVVSCARIS